MTPELMRNKYERRYWRRDDGNVGGLNSYTVGELYYLAGSH